MLINPALLQLSLSISQVGIVTFLVNVIAPFLERYAPFAKPGSSTHDATLRLLNLACNIGLALGCAAALNQLSTSQAIIAAVGLGIAQTTGSHVLYTSGNRPQPSVAAVPSAAPTVAPPLPSLATLAAPSASAVAAAVNAAMAAQASASR